MQQNDVRNEIKKLIADFVQLRDSGKEFIPGKTKVQYSGPVYDAKELNAIIDSLLDGWFGLSRKAMEFEDKLAGMIGAKSAVVTNSGSSANLLSVAALTSHDFKNHLSPGDEVITPATTFPTTLNPLVQHNLSPVLLDSDIGTYNVSASAIEQAVTPKTKAIMLPHTLGNPNELDAVMEIAESHELFVIEDTADALGSKYSNKMLGSFGNFGTFSFYVAHHITMGEGGAVAIRDEEFDTTVRSLRDWGRACACKVCSIALNPDSKCPYRFKSTAKNLPEDYDAKYLYSTIGYNLKPLELQAAMGLVQLGKLGDFISARKNNFKEYYNFFSGYEDYFILPESLPKAEPCWFSFPLTIKDNAGFSRQELLSWLEKCNIESRLLFSGNISKHPAYAHIKFKTAGPLENADKIMRDSFFIGIYPGITKEQRDYVMQKFEEFLKKV